MMKMNNGSKKAFGIILFAVVSAGVLLGIVFRTMQLHYAIDFSTGFYKEWHYSLPALDTVLLGAAVLVVLLSILLKRKPLYAVLPKRLGGSLLPFFCAAGLAAQTILQMVQTTEWGIWLLVSSVLAAVSVVCFILLGLQQALAKPGVSGYLFRNMVLTLWCCCQMLTVFFERSSESNTSEFVFIILFLYASTVFFIKYGKLTFYSQPDYHSSFSLLLSASFLSLFGFTLSVPNIILLCTGGASPADFSPIACAALPLAVYGFSFLFINCLSSPQKQEPAKSSASEAMEA